MLLPAEALRKRDVGVLDAWGVRSSARGALARMRADAQRSECPRRCFASQETVRTVTTSYSRPWLDFAVRALRALSLHDARPATGASSAHFSFVVSRRLCGGHACFCAGSPLQASMCCAQPRRCSRLSWRGAGAAGGGGPTCAGSCTCSIRTRFRTTGAHPSRPARGSRAFLGRACRLLSPRDELGAANGTGVARVGAQAREPQPAVRADVRLLRILVSSRTSCGALAAVRCMNHGAPERERHAAGWRRRFTR